MEPISENKTGKVRQSHNQKINHPVNYIPQRDMDDLYHSSLMNDTGDEDTALASKSGKIYRSKNRKQFISSIESETVSKQGNSIN
jgi:hypothetical protein